MEGFSKIDQFLFQMIPPKTKVEDGLKHFDLGFFKMDGGMDSIGKGLSIGARRTVRDFRMRRFDVDDAREENPFHPFL
jgi:hypothetical protein